MITYLKRGYHRRVRPLFDRKVSYKMNEKTHGQPFIVLVTNLCFEGCFSCSSKSDKNIDPYVMPLRELDIFLKNMDGYLPEKPVRLSGGEPTTVGSEVLWSYAKTVKKHKRRLEILTNGYGLLSVDVNVFDRIILDEHISNQDRIKQIRRHLLKLKHRNWIIYPMHYHQDINTMINNSVTDGPKCREWMNSITLTGGVVYPCCMLSLLETWIPPEDITKDLIEAGYTYDNPDLPELLTNWKEHIPTSVYKRCLLTCWRHEGQKKSKWYPTHDT